MVLELKVPHGIGLDVLAPLFPVFLTYVLSFLYVGIYWNNHHHIFKLVDAVDGTVLWANLHLLFWLSLLPFTTGWMGENHFQRWPATLYGLNLLFCAIAFLGLQWRLIAIQGSDGALQRAVGSDLKGKATPWLYVLGIGLTWLVSPTLGTALYAGAALVWLVPDTRMEQAVRSG